MTIPEDHLSLTLADVLVLHDPRRRTYNGASVEQLSAALRALEARLAKQEAVRRSKLEARLR